MELWTGVLFETPALKSVFYDGGQKSSYDNAVSAIDDIFNQWDASTATLI